ncbi:Flagellar assembly factor FliW [Candidatus Zixiibacteriota bacterium]|nr:Flagellar assembly factor FliW [candidate division Zixibacteria bacterium]
MRITSLKFGEIDVPEDKIVLMAKPILGFENLKRYCIVEREDCAPFLWFQSLDDPTIVFIIVNPLYFYSEYRIEVNPKEVEELHISDVRAVETYVIVTIPSEPSQMTVNLQGPLLINTETRLAKQMVLANSEYGVKHYLLSDIERSEEPVEADAELQPVYSR